MPTIRVGAGEDTVRVRGLKELRAAQKGSPREVRAAVGKAHKGVAERLVAAPARARAQSVSARTARLARPGVITGRGTTTAARVALSTTAGVPDAFGQEFGSKRFAQFLPWRGNASETTWLDSDRAGYALFPTIRAQKERIVEAYLDAVDQAMRKVFPQ